MAGREFSADEPTDFTLRTFRQLLTGQKLSECAPVGFCLGMTRTVNALVDLQRAAKHFFRRRTIVPALVRVAEYRRGLRHARMILAQCLLEDAKSVASGADGSIDT